VVVVVCDWLNKFGFVWADLTLKTRYEDDRVVEQRSRKCQKYLPRIAPKTNNRLMIISYNRLKLIS